MEEDWFENEIIKSTPQTFVLDLETDGLECTNNRILMIGIMELSSEQIMVLEGNEEGMLKQLHKFVNHVVDKHGTIKFIGHNIRDFDLQFLRERGRYYGLDFGDSIKYFDTYLQALQTKPSLDCYSLNSLCKLFGISINFDVSGADIPRLWLENRTEEIRQHLLDDLIKTKELFCTLTNGGETND
jgi:DNA polymerase III epsilon subunit-like protein